MFQTVWALYLGDNNVEYWTSLSTATRWLIQHTAIVECSDPGASGTPLDFPYIRGIQPLMDGKARMTDYRFYVDRDMLRTTAKNIGITVGSMAKGDWSPLLQQCVRIMREAAP